MSQAALELATDPSSAVITPEQLIPSANPALLRLAAAVKERDATGSTVNYSRMHHRHARSHTRR
jgi:hypothetical protein